MKKLRKQIQRKGSEHVEEKPRVSYDDVQLEQLEQLDDHISPDRILDFVEAGEAETWEAVDERLDSVDGDTIRRNVAQVNAREWLEASKALATEAKRVADGATSRQEIFKVDAMVDAFDRDMKQRKINIQPCRLHCQNAIRDAYARLS